NEPILISTNIPTLQKMDRVPEHEILIWLPQQEISIRSGDEIRSRVISHDGCFSASRETFRRLEGIVWLTFFRNIPNQQTFVTMSSDQILTVRRNAQISLTKRWRVAIRCSIGNLGAWGESTRMS